MEIGKQLKFTKSSFKDVNGLFVQYLPNSRYHLHIYSRDSQLAEKLSAIAKPSADQHFKTLEIGRNNVLFAVPPFNNSFYRVRLMQHGDPLHERVIQFTTGPNRFIMDILLLVDITKHPIDYIVCNRDTSFIGFKNGTDAMLVMDILRTHSIIATLSTSTAYVQYMENNNNNSAPSAIQPLIPAVNRAENHRRVGSRMQVDLRNNINHRSASYQGNLRVTRRFNGGNRGFNRRQYERNDRGFNGEFRQQPHMMNRSINIGVPEFVSPEAYNIIFVPKN